MNHCLAVPRSSEIELLFWFFISGKGGETVLFSRICGKIV
ncbi:hypothetical protein STRPO_1719 [Streptococcus porcinus str. Jelinkova 176]|uniref:Uncharacterized protein n=1 Tax=Streptococcus porcinus str. Jelinkova 176 TaxID=873448 RepID=A0ABN0CYC3_STRPO|nr:hypothetical protein STRPO_1719 [Streptococcus porcinus str. Jelinkova 176]